MFEKPDLTRLNGQPIPDSFVDGKRFAFMDSSHRRNLLASRRTFKRYGKSAWVCDLLPKTAEIVDEISIVKTCKPSCLTTAGKAVYEYREWSIWSSQHGVMGDTGLAVSAKIYLALWFCKVDLAAHGGAVLCERMPSTYQGVPLRNQVIQF